MLLHETIMLFGKNVFRQYISCYFRDILTLVHETMMWFCETLTKPADPSFKKKPGAEAATLEGAESLALTKIYG